MSPARARGSLVGGVMQLRAPPPRLRNSAMPGSLSPASASELYRATMPVLRRPADCTELPHAPVVVLMPHKGSRHRAGASVVPPVQPAPQLETAPRGEAGPEHYEREERAARTCDR